MTQTPTFEASLIPFRQSALDTDHWGDVMQTFEEGKFKETVLGVLNYVNSEVVAKHANAAGTEFNLPHGSMTIQVKITPDSYSFSAPFLALPDKGSVALLRQLTEINFATLNVSQIVLNGNNLSFTYSSPLELCNPFKFYYTLQEICNTADHYDDIFVEKFGAKRLHEPPIERYTPDQHALAKERYRNYLKEGLEATAAMEASREYDWAWYTAFIYLMKVYYVIEPQGYLLSEFNKVVNTLYGDNSINERLNACKAGMKKLLEVDDAKLDTYLYKPTFFMSPKLKLSMEQLREELKPKLEWAVGQVPNHAYMPIALYLTYVIYDIFHRFDVTSVDFNLMQSALVSSGGRPWKEAAETLVSSLQALMTIQPK